LFSFLLRFSNHFAGNFLFAFFTHQPLKAPKIFLSKRLNHEKILRFYYLMTKKGKNLHIFFNFFSTFFRAVVKAF